MSKPKPSFAAILMYAIIAVAAISSAICLGIYYLNISCNAVLLWTGIVAFMIMYHLWVRIIFGNMTKLFKPDYNNLWFREKKFEKLVYVSCDNATLARDAKILREYGYELNEVHVFDQFPQTGHTECCVLLCRTE